MFKFMFYMLVLKLAVIFGLPLLLGFLGLQFLADLGVDPSNPAVYWTAIGLGLLVLFTLLKRILFR